MSDSRPRRATAGRLMGKLIEEEEEEGGAKDEFYATTYGGFKDEEGDTEYQMEEDHGDIVDSDFSNSEESDEAKSADDEDDKKKRKKKAPVKLSKALIKPQGPGDKPAVKRKPREKVQISAASLDPRRERMRASTMESSVGAENARRRRAAETEPRRHGKTGGEMRRFTQEELLAEAVVTEQENLKSLEKFLKLEAEKKKVKQTKVRYQGPIVRFQSIRMPILDQSNSGISTANQSNDSTNPSINQSSQEFCSRNFLVFTDAASFPKSYFPARRATPVEQPVCVVTGLAARYREPLTGLPYANAEAFRYIRQHRRRIVADMQQKRAEKKRRRKSGGVTCVKEGERTIV